MRARMKKDSEGTWVLLPHEAAKAYENCDADVAELKNGIFACMPAAREAAQKAGVKNAGGLELTEDEHAVAKKMFSIRFENRLVPMVEKTLNPNEKKALARLLARKLITVFAGGKYAKGVYNISELLYVHLKQEAPQQQAAAPSGQPQTSMRAPINSLGHLATVGYMVLDNEFDAKNIMPEMQEQIKAGTVKGVRGFDRKYYVLTKGFRLANEQKLLALLEKGENTVDKLAAALGMPPDAARTLLLVLADEGEVIEKNMRRGVWTRA